MSRRLLVALCAAWVVGAALDASAHPLRPALLRLEATEPGGGPLDVTLKLPSAGDRAAPVGVVFPERCRSVTSPRSFRVEDGVLQRWRVDCGEAGLSGATLHFTDLSRRVGEVLVLLDEGAGAPHTAVARADSPSVTLGEEGGPTLWRYLPLGVEHILLGIDHLLFVLGLMLLVFARGVGRREFVRLLWTITAFTAAHSMTLAAAALGLVAVPSDAVETVIALSILLLAVEVARPVEAAPTWTSTRPAAVAFAFGLLHGFGFAGALAELGLPEDGVLGALLLFNVGVELGQIAFVAALLAVGWGLRRASTASVSAARVVTVHALGALAVYWCLERGGALLERLAG